MERKIKIAPSLLSCDFSRLGEEIRKVEGAGCDLLHVDVMDGLFVPNITIGPGIVKAISRNTKLPVDVHLMIQYPEKYIEDFASSGANILTIHVEACRNPRVLLRKIRSLGAKPSISIKPATPIFRITKLLDEAEMVLVMSVNPGFGGQKFMPVAIPKIRTLRKIFDKDIEVDGGINSKNARLVAAAGANILVAGTYLFGAKDIRRAIARLRSCQG